MAGYGVNIDQNLISSERSDEEYGDWSEEYQNTFSGLYQDNNYPDVNCSLDLNVGDRVFLVWLEYSTGDSFGYSNRGEVASLGIFKEYKYAAEFAKFIEEPPTEYTYRGEYTSEDGQVISIHYAWTGYFEHLDEVHIEDTIIREGKKW